LIGLEIVENLFNDADILQIPASLGGYARSSRTSLYRCYWNAEFTKVTCDRTTSSTDFQDRTGK
jgi:hypothetical protein